uniref:VWFA domain-containing protein n=1 Tax=Haptolina brevifila TaxID=156173 RepID=A0A7S2NB47_9EUKA
MGNLFSASPSRRNSRASFSNVVVSEQPIDQQQSEDTQPVEGVPVREGIVAATVAAPQTGQRLALAITGEKEALAAGERHKLLAMLSLKAPSAPESAPRPPLDLVIAADRSGSMQGEKIRLMRQTLDLLVKRSGLGPDDRVSLVSFDSQVKLELPLESMDGAGRAKAEAVVNRLQPGSTTNLSGGALKAIDVLDASAPRSSLVRSIDKAKKRTRAVMLFTDGLANEGIRDTAALCAAVGGALRAASNKLGGPISLFTFGFGSDHNEDCLRRLANESGTSGQYYYVRTAEDIPNAFADCLGGLTSVVAQNAQLSLEGVGGASVARVLGSAYKYSEGVITLGDLFAEDEKDCLVELEVPALPETTRQPTTVLRVSLRAFNITTNAPEVVEATLEIVRPAATPADQKVQLAASYSTPYGLWLGLG